LKSFIDQNMIYCSVQAQIHFEETHGRYLGRDMQHFQHEKIHLERHWNRPLFTRNHLYIKFHQPDAEPTGRKFQLSEVLERW